MQTKEMKKLSINKLSEYPVIGIEEQMMLKGGDGRLRIFLKIVKEFISGAADASQIWDFFTKNPDTKTVPTDDILRELNKFHPSDSITIDSITVNGIYGLKIYGLNFQP